MMGGGMMGGSGFGGLGSSRHHLNLVIMVGVIVGIVLLVVWLVRRVGSEGPGARGPEVANSCVRSLQARYAAAKSPATNTSRCCPI
jgi:hypothetical protein